MIRTLEELKRLKEAATPGPWHLSKDRQTITQTSHVTRDVWTIPRTEDDMELVAAAPDILDQLIAQLEALPTTDQDRMYYHMEEASKLLRQFNERSKALEEGRIFPGDESA